MFADATDKKTVMLNIVARSHQGLVRRNNEDFIYASAEDGFAVLADGMGGLLAGEIASEVAVVTARHNLEAGAARDSAQALSALVNLSHNAVLAEARERNYLGKMGTTLIVWAQAPDQRSFFGHVGDSRLYAYSRGRLEQLTRDHTVAQRLIDSGEVDGADEHDVPHRHILTQALGMPGVFQPQATEVPTCDRLLLCSDGLSDLVRREQLQEIMTDTDGERCADHLLKAALDAGGSDNVSVILVDFE